MAGDLAHCYEDCWRLFNAGKYDQLVTEYYTADAIREVPGLEFAQPVASGRAAIREALAQSKRGFADLAGTVQLVLVDSRNLVSVVLLTGTNTEPVIFPFTQHPATNRKVGVMSGYVVRFDGTANRIAHEWQLWDVNTVFGQIEPPIEHPVRPVIEKLTMPKEVVHAERSDTERANLAADRHFVETHNKHDEEAFAALFDNKATWFEAAVPVMFDKQGILDSNFNYWKAFSDTEIVTTSQWAVGQYVVLVGNFLGTNDADFPMANMKKTGKKMVLPFLQINKYEAGKIKSTWLFYQALTIVRQLGLPFDPSIQAPQ